MALEAEERKDHLAVVRSLRKHWGTNTRYADIYRLRNVENMSLEEVGRWYGVTRERVRQFEARISEFLITTAGNHD